MVIVGDGGRVIVQIRYANAESPRLLGAGCHAISRPGPIIIDGRVFGVIGVSGSAPQKDEDIARAAATTAVADR